MAIKGLGQIGKIIGKSGEQIQAAVKKIQPTAVKSLRKSANAVDEFVSSKSSFRVLDIGNSEKLEKAKAALSEYVKKSSEAGSSLDKITNKYLKK